MNSFFDKVRKSVENGLTLEEANALYLEDAKEFLKNYTEASDILLRDCLTLSQDPDIINLLASPDVATAMSRSIGDTKIPTTFYDEVAFLMQMASFITIAKLRRLSESA